MLNMKFQLGTSEVTANKERASSGLLTFFKYLANNNRKGKHDHWSLVAPTSTKGHTLAASAYLYLASVIVCVCERECVCWLLGSKPRIQSIWVVVWYWSQTSGGGAGRGRGRPTYLALLMDRSCSKRDWQSCSSLSLSRSWFSVLILSVFSRSNKI